MRLYDSRINRWTTTDPYYQHHSPYLAMENNWISRIDPDGGQNIRVYGDGCSVAATNFGCLTSNGSDPYAGSGMIQTDAMQGMANSYYVTYDVLQEAGATGIINSSYAGYNQTGTAYNIETKRKYISGAYQSPYGLDSFNNYGPETNYKDQGGAGSGGRRESQQAIHSTVFHKKPSQNNDWLRTSATAYLIFLQADIVVVEPTDAAWPKWVVHVILGGISSIVVYDSIDDFMNQFAKSKPGQSGDVSGAEHTSGTRKSTKSKHQQGQTRKQQKNRDKKRQKSNWKPRR